MRQPEIDLLGVPLNPPARARKIGYAARPGSGPKGKRCNMCKHAMRMTSATRRAWKCAAQVAQWDDTAATDIKPGAPACSEWERRNFSPTPPAHV